MSDILRLTLYDRFHQKFAEFEVPADNEKKVSEVLLLLRAKGVKLRLSKKNDEHPEWW